MSTFVSGRYELSESSDNFGLYLKTLGLGVIQRQIAVKLKPIVELDVDKDGVYTLKTLTMLKNMEVQFSLGQEFHEETPDGRKYKTIVTLESDNKLVHIQKPILQNRVEPTEPSSSSSSHHPSSSLVVTIREFHPDRMDVTFVTKDVTAKRIYKRL